MKTNTYTMYLQRTVHSDGEVVTTVDDYEWGCRHTLASREITFAYTEKDEEEVDLKIIEELREKSKELAAKYAVESQQIDDAIQKILCLEAPSED